MKLPKKIKEKINSIRELLRDNSRDIIAFAISVVLSLSSIVFLYFLVGSLLSPLHLTGPDKYFIITIIVFILWLPFIIGSICQIVILIFEAISVWKQFESDKQSVWNLFLSYIRNNAMIFALVIIYILFYHYWENWIGNHIIDPYLCHFESNLLSDIIFFIAVITCIVIILVKVFSISNEIEIRLQNVKQQTLIISIIAMVIWAYYRFNHGLCGMNGSSYYMGFTSLSIFKPIKYFDIVIVFAIYEYISYLLWKFQIIGRLRLQFSNTDGLTRNLPISTKDDDLLDRDELAQSVVKKLWATNTENNSFTCGIDAPWGSGKTSFINLIKSNIDYQHSIRNRIIIDFNPWLYAVEKDLVTAFFNELSNTLKQYNTSLAKNLIDYSKLLSAFDTTETKLISSLSELTQHNDSSLQEKKLQISNAIKRINKRIIVFIDDLDRLEANELLEMMKLIRNVSNFPYMYMIAAYDKSYVVKCLNIKMKSGANNYIEKIFEHEYILAPCSNESLRRALADQLQRIDDGRFLKPEFEDYIMNHNNKALDALSNLREIYLLSNNIDSTNSLLKPERYHIVDLILFGLFKTKYPVAFSLFEHKWREILIPIDCGNHQYYELFQGKDYDGNFDFIKYLDNNKDKMCIDEFDMKTIKMILSELFMRHENEDYNVHRISNARWFNRCLNLTQLKSDITEKEFNEVMSKPLNEIEKAIDNWSVDKPVSLKYRLLNYDKKNKLDREQLENNIHLIFYASNKNHWKIYDEINHVICHLKRFSNDKYSEKDRSFIKEQLKNADFSQFMSNYIGYLYNRYNKNKKNEEQSIIQKLIQTTILTKREKENIDIPIDEEDLIEVQKCIFSDCCKKNSDFGSDYSSKINLHRVLTVFSSLLDTDGYSDISHNSIQIKPHDNYATILVNSMQDFIKDTERIVFFLQVIIESHYSPECYSIHPIAKTIWGTWSQFSVFLSGLDESNQIISEFKAFYNEFETNNHHPIPFDFERINRELFI